MTEPTSPNRSSDESTGPRLVDETAFFSELETDPGARDKAIEAFRPLAEGLARRYQGYGEPLDDLVQVASIGLINAVDRFDPSRGIHFSAYATPTIVGELKRHFRDRGWAIRMPRRLQENTLKVRRVMGELTQELGRSPTVTELAETSALSEEEVIEATEALQAYTTSSLDAPLGEDTTLGETLAATDEHMETVEGWADLGPHIERLEPRERKILVLRFFRGLTQTEIASEIGVSQMHVSRLLGRALAQLRRELVRREEV